jgi:preprotein translocase subunit YajC
VFLAQDGGSSSGLLNFLPIILIIAAMYFLLIRPQSKRRREATEMQSRLGPGDEVQTVGGLFGTVVAIDDEAITIEAAEGVHLRFARSAIGRVVNAQPRDPVQEDDDDNDARPIENG